jgi:tagatose-1,6-bisphosphate aldolase non-catalytic subunit AgaZ/GatZ
VFFAATLNQIDIDGGYTGYTHLNFVNHVYFEAKKINFTAPIIFGVDHGGAWQKDLHREKILSYKVTINKVKESFMKALDAGFTHFHIDTGRDPQKELSINMMVQRAVSLIQFIESYRKSMNYPVVSYEVGSEEKFGNIQDNNEFDYFLDLLYVNLKKAGLESVFPEFVVGNIKTDLYTDVFEKKTARKLIDTARKYRCLIKAHYTDNIKNLKDFPKIGVGGANVGPEFTEIEYDSLILLQTKEKELFNTGKIENESNIKNVLWAAVIQSNKWRKWITVKENSIDFYANSSVRQAWFVKTGCRYIWKDLHVVKARKQLYKNLKDNGTDATHLLQKNIEKAMDKYFKAFNLIDLNKHI